MKNTLYSLIVTFVLIVTPSVAQAQDEVACTMQYAPVCGTEKGIYKTYGNGCTLGASGAVYQHEGECTADEIAGRQQGTYVPPAHCTAWNDGCNSCGRGTDGQSFCTLMACMGEPLAGYCTAYQETTPEQEPAKPNRPANSGAGAVNSSVASESALAPEIATTATASADKNPGFFFDIWRAVSAWFSSLF